MKKKPLAEKEEQEVWQKIGYSTRNVAAYRSILAPYQLSDEQIDLLIKWATSDVNSAASNLIAQEVIAYLESIRPQKEL